MCSSTDNDEEGKTSTYVGVWVCNTLICPSLSLFYKNRLLQHFYALRANLIIYKNLPIYGIRAIRGTTPIDRDSFIRTAQSQTSLAGKYCQICPMKDDFFKDFIRTIGRRSAFYTVPWDWSSIAPSFCRLLSYRSTIGGALSLENI